jgi:hypothetical protein
VLFVQQILWQLLGEPFFPFIFWNKNNKERYEERETKHNESMREKVDSTVIQI